MIESDPTKKVKVESALDRLKLHSKVVADSGDFNEIAKYQPEDSTTNPSLLLQVAAKPEFAHILDASVKYGLENFYHHCVDSKKRKGKKAAETPKVAVYEELTPEQKVELDNLVLDHVSVSFGCEILKKIPGYISTEIDASLSFDVPAMVKRALRIIQLYAENGVSSNRVLIKVASTWEGVQAAEELRKKKINCNMTLIFSKVQAVACAQAQLFLISPFVGRILDWNKKNQPTGDFTGANDPGVKSVTEIYNYFKKHGHKTIIMGASFRNTDEILELAGCDRLTISPALLKDLEASTAPVPAKLTEEHAKTQDIPVMEITESTFRHHLNNDAMATEKLAEGIRKFE